MWERHHGAGEFFFSLGGPPARDGSMGSIIYIYTSTDDRNS